jgi:predicted secreted protein
MVYGESSNGLQAEVVASEEFEIALPETRTAGYRWTTVHKGEPACQLLEESSQPNTTGVGGSSIHRWRFRAVSSGTGEIEFHYARSWERSPGPAKIFTLKVRVRP